jgi:hypothetical protein
MIGFIAQDMGGANLVLHHAKNFNFDKKIFAFGPARKLCSQLKLEKFMSNDYELNFNSDSIIAGANFKNSSKKSDKLLRQFESRNLTIHGYLDGWEFLNCRFPNVKIENYFVTDHYAYNIAVKFFPGKVKMLPNYYLNQVKLDLDEIKLGNKFISNDSVLLITQPNIQNQDNYNKFIHGQHCICSDLSKIFHSFLPRSIVVRDHVRLNSLDCINYFSSKFQINLVLTNSMLPLAQDLSNCKIICGAPNQALFFAQQLGFETYITKKVPKEWKGPKFDYLS